MSPAAMAECCWARSLDHHVFLRAGAECECRRCDHYPRRDRCRAGGQVNRSGSTRRIAHWNDECLRPSLARLESVERLLALIVLCVAIVGMNETDENAVPVGGLHHGRKRQRDCSLAARKSSARKINETRRDRLARKTY